MLPPPGTLGMMGQTQLAVATQPGMKASLGKLADGERAGLSA